MIQMQSVLEVADTEEAARTEVEGTGLGLAIVRQILRMHGCTIRATSPKGGGAVLAFTLPLAREDETPSQREVHRRSSVDVRSPEP